MGVDDGATILEGPITRLNSDVLWNIFFINSELDSRRYGHDRLNTARSSSQVCRQWRQVLLSLPVLWGRLIDLDHLHINNHEGLNPWREEVLSRAGTSLLWVEGSVNLRTQDFFFSFLDEHWQRIERLDIRVGVFSREVVRGWDRLERHVPHLQAFNLTCDRKPELLPLLVSHGGLFKDGAPSLKELSVPGLRFDLMSCPWITNIRKMTLSHPFTIHEIFDIMAKAQQLESLEIAGKAGRGRQLNPFFELYPDDELPAVCLPRLKEFTLRGHFTVVLPFLERVTFGSSCRIYLALKEEFDWKARRRDRTRDGTEVHVERLQIIQQKVISLLRRNLLVHQVKVVTIKCEDDFLSFSAYTDMDQLSTVSVYGTFGLGSGPAILREILLCGGLAHVREMSLSISIADQTSLAILDHIPSGLPSLKALRTSEESLKFFLENKSTSCPSFPALDSIKLTQLIPAPSRSSCSSDMVCLFCQYQLSGGSPISLIDLTTVPYHELHDMAYLDDLPMLQMVKWTLPNKEITEYKCGSGKSNFLQFRTNRELHEAEKQAEAKDCEVDPRLLASCILCIWDSYSIGHCEETKDSQ